MRDFFMMFMAVFFFAAALLVVLGSVSRTLIGSDDGYLTHGFWEMCVQDTDQRRINNKWDCHPFDWPNRVNGIAAADRVRAVQGFGTMAFIAGVLILTSPLTFVLLLLCDVSHRVMSSLFVGTFWLMGLCGSLTWILLEAYFDDVTVDDYVEGFYYEWGAYVFMIGTGMTAVVIPVTLCCCLNSRNAVKPL